ncbi:transcription factor TFIID complex subunit Taf5- like [Schizosaccharomyces japonicus yFS275]|uniref:Transcription factor TFIID complex subunit Taf5-like n=1 Tax=Schizosaccharomyces japonicus (strain yFS275 / FY16936) TaxID=402676 RepID=B6K3C3_SCHJY|nr:transcription factor TFIID complex subunit Taf5- like [Schizosaccharomyces japonicus yFS275]EEB07980.1 transcription factor TFIID complex subunit Taf5- like [Schizosaccharomyces japonicus yFS275]
MAHSSPHVPPTSTPDLNKIVLDYLSKKGYSRTEAILRLEASSVGAVPEDQQDWHLGLPETYVQVYAALRDWIDSTLDMFKPELQKTLFPIFVHSFLDLITKSAISTAKVFFESFSQEHLILHGHDVHKLEDITSPADLEQNSVAALYRKHKYRLNFSQTTFGLLLHFLFENESNGSGIIIRLLNQYIDINIKSSTKHQGATKSTEQYDEGIPQHSEQLNEFNSQEIYLGRIPLSTEDEEALLKVLDNYDSQKGDESEDVAMDTVITQKAHDTQEETSIKAPCRPLREVYEDRKKRESAYGKAPESLPLPPLEVADLDAIACNLDDERNCIQFDKDAKGPSVYMFSLHNSYSTLNCATFSQDASMFLVGTSENYLQLYTSTNSQRQSLISAKKEQLKQQKFIGHKASIYGVSISRDNRFLLSGSGDGFVRLWSPETGSTLSIFGGHNAPIWDVEFDPNGFYFATAADDHTARLWSVEHPSPLRLFVGHENDVDCVKIHKNSAYVLTGSSDTTCRLWDVRTSDAVRVLIGHKQPISALAISDDGLDVISADDSGHVFVWDLRKGQKRHSFQAHNEPIYSLDVSKEGKLLASGGIDTVVKFWDIQTSETIEEPLYTYRTKNTVIHELQFTNRNFCLSLSTS